MELSTLKNLRIFIPGLLVLLCLWELIKFLNITFEIDDFKGTILLTIVPFILGAAYNLSNLRFLITKNTLNKIDKNISDSLIKILPPTYSNYQIQVLRKGSTLKHIFYSIVDHDNSLQIKAKNVYNNGIYWSSTADLAIIAFISSLLYFVIYFFLNGSDKTISFAILLLVVSILGFMVHLKVSITHIKLSQDQLDYIKTNCRITLIQKIDAVLQ